LRQQKELIDRILENTPNAVAVVDNNQNLMLANRAFCDCFKKAKGKIVGEKLSAVVPIKNILESVLKVFLNGKEQYQVEFRQISKNSNRICMATILSMNKNQALIIINDVTEEREKQERLYLTDRLASVGEMASGIAHELNNPLTGVIGLSQLMVSDEKLPEELKEDANAIYSEAQRAASVVKNLLTFARKHKPNRDLTQLNNIIDEVLKLRAYEHKVNNIQIITELDPELPETIVDHFQIQQVFLNIILNAENAMIEANKGGILKISTYREDDIIRISFTDDGQGISQDNLDRLFDPFFTTKEVGKGTGLGLSISYGIITSHNGKIYAQNGVNKGAIFNIELPVLTSVEKEKADVYLQ